MSGRGMLIASFFILAALTLGISVGERIGERVAAARFDPMIERNALDIACLQADLGAMTDRVISLSESISITGIASHYGSFEDGRATKSGEIFDRRALTAALVAPLPYRGTWRVTRLDTGASVTVRVNDRLPSKWGRLIDLSEGAAKLLGMIDAGIVRVQIRPVGD
jgi:rare lipoprotein A